MYQLEIIFLFCLYLMEIFPETRKDLQKLEIPGADGLAEAYVYRPPVGKGPWPGVVFLTDVFGIREVNQGMARRVADEGFVVAMPNIFYRTDRLPVVDLDKFKFGEEESMKRLHQLLANLNGDQMRRDGKAYADYLLSQTNVQKGKIGVVGYCLTGQMALRTAALIPDQIGAAASFHGGGLVTKNEDSPHLDIPRVKAELYFGHAENDRTMTQENIEVLDKALASWGGKYQSELYRGAQHGWTVPGRDNYNHDQAEIAFVKLIELFRRNLP